MSASGSTTVLMVECDVLIRLALAAYLRGCGFVVEAADGTEAKVVLKRGPEIKHFISDAQLAGADSGFAPAQWVWRYCSGITVVLTASLSSKTQAASEFCTDGDTREYESDELAVTIRSARGREVVGWDCA